MGYLVLWLVLLFFRRGMEIFLLGLLVVVYRMYVGLWIWGLLLMCVFEMVVKGVLFLIMIFLSCKVRFFFCFGGGCGVVLLFLFLLVFYLVFILLYFLL